MATCDFQGGCQSEVRIPKSFSGFSACRHYRFCSLPRAAMSLYPEGQGVWRTTHKAVITWKVQLDSEELRILLKENGFRSSGFPPSLRIARCSGDSAQVWKWKLTFVLYWKLGWVWQWTKWASFEFLVSGQGKKWNISGYCLFLNDSEPQVPLREYKENLLCFLSPWLSVFWVCQAASCRNLSLCWLPWYQNINFFEFWHVNILFHSFQFPQKLFSDGYIS